MANDTEVQMGIRMGMNMKTEGDDLPQDCKAVIMSMTSPVDTCRCSAVSPLFKLAAEFDFVWERFLPIEYQSILSQSVIALFPSKKELYLYLCDNPTLIDEGKKTFFLDKPSGKKCYMLSARDLLITWADTPDYWIWTSLPESRFEEVAEFIRVRRLEIRGKIDVEMLSPSTLYSAYFVFKVAVGAFGIQDQAVEIAVGFVGKEAKKQTAYFEPRITMDPNSVFAEERYDGWLEIELGEFSCEEGQIGELEMSVLEIEAENWKGGLIVEGIEIRPKVIKTGAANSLSDASTWRKNFLY